MILLTAFLLLAAETPTPPNQLADQWNVEGAILSPQDLPGSAAFHFAAFPSGDLDGDGLGGISLIGLSENQSTGEIVDIAGLQPGPNRSLYNFLFPDDASFTLLHTTNPEFTILRTPRGPVFCAEYAPSPNNLLFFSLQTRAKVGESLMPPPGPGEPAIGGWGSVKNAGDLNQDGYDDVFFTTSDASGHEGFVGMLDGATRSLVWRNFYSQTGTTSADVAPNPIRGYPDLNADGVPDFVAHMTWYQTPWGPLQGGVVALDGLSGSTIWEQWIPGLATLAGATSHDLNGDGIPEVISQVGYTIDNRLVARDGSDGHELWSTQITDLHPFLPLSPVIVLASPVFYREAPASGPPTHVCSTVLQQDPNTGDLVWSIGVFRASDGVAVGGFPITGSLEPYLPDSFGGGYFTTNSVGDIDRDGYTEFIHFAAAASEQLPGAPYPPSAAMVMGPPTLDFPGSLSVTAAGYHHADFSIPSAAGMFVKLLMSLGFDQETGFTHDGWNTWLVPDRFFQATSQAQLIAWLDQNGEGTVSFTLPNNSALIGRRIYARGVVADPSAPLDKVWTLSSPGYGTIWP